MRNVLMIQLEEATIFSVASAGSNKTRKLCSGDERVSVTVWSKCEPKK